MPLLSWLMPVVCTHLGMHLCLCTGNTLDFLVWLLRDFFQLSEFQEHLTSYEMIIRKNQPEGRKWDRSLKNGDRICSLHFQQDDIKKFHEDTIINGKFIKGSPCKPVLKDGALPSIFTGSGFESPLLTPEVSYARDSFFCRWYL